MKKLVSIGIVIAMCLMVAACGNSQPQTANPAQPDEETGVNILDPQSIISEDEELVDVEAIKANFEKATAYVESVIDTSKMTYDTDDQGEDGMYRYWYFEEEPAETKLSDEIALDGKSIVIGETLMKDLAGLGFEVAKIDDTVQPGEIQSVNINKGDKSFVLSSIANDTDKPLQLDDLPVYEFQSGIVEYAIPFDYMGITAESKIEDVLGILGAPNGNLNLSSDKVNTSIELLYSNESQEGDAIIGDTLSMYFVYNADSNSAVISSIIFTRNVYQAEEE